MMTSIFNYGTGFAAVWLMLAIALTQCAGGAAPANSPGEPGVSRSMRQRFRGFKTDLSRRSIDLEKIYDGGPGKDGIPAIHDPEFVALAEAEATDSTWGVLVTFGDEQRYYPYDILVWHEIVNDTIGDKAFAVTYCPLCGSAIVFDRSVASTILRFGVSGKLYESNLLMYDDRTESLWSQSRGEAVVGEYTGSRLELFSMQMLRLDEIKQRYPQARVLSRETGFRRSYGRSPYGGYEHSDRFYFPVSVQDNRFPAKEMMYVFVVGGRSVAVPVHRLPEGKAYPILAGKTVEISRSGSEIGVNSDGQAVPGYFEMWFSWATHHQQDGIVWNPEGY